MFEVSIALVAFGIGYGARMLQEALKAHAAKLEADAKATAKRARAQKAANKRSQKAMAVAEKIQAAATNGGTDASLYGRKNGAAGEVSWPAA